ncbi:ABC transporter ATP-binding protein [Nocardioides sp.]|uniref:ABC transporter ATP-binding protein n=1 Tax=Nocardioides sp. TaxID=35761 RepID=UPI0026039CCB|nr:ABC transporter ATP-binding protein [Nocardioides sp.]MCW2736810.1 urea transporter, ATP-binding protein UrtD [Nocardioides sp.]
MTSGSEALLEVRAVSKSYGGVHAVDSASFTVHAGTTHCVIGSNGAGKTTLFDVVSGATKASSGTIMFAGHDITRRGADHVSRLGLVRTYQSPRPIPAMTALANVELAAAGRAADYGLGKLLRHRSEVTERARRLLELCHLGAGSSIASALSHGARKRLEFAMALACEPRMLLLDEPTAGMNPEETDEMAAILGGLNRELTVAIIEHDLAFVRRIADRVTFMHRGRVLCDGTLSEVESDERVQRIYVGRED